MPSYVLRNPNLPDQPIVIDVAEGQELSVEYKRAEWAIDPDTTPEDLAVVAAPQPPAEPATTEPVTTGSKSKKE